MLQRTLPRKKPNAIGLIFHISASMALVFLTPLPIRKVCRDAFLLASECAVKPLVTLSFMDYFFRRLPQYFLKLTKVVEISALPPALRREVKLVPENTIRELVGNALIHQNLLISGVSVMVEVYTNRIEISNPGEPVVPIERFIDGYQSRNERLANLMRRFGICEEKSSGIDKVINAAEEFQLPAPNFHAATIETGLIKQDEAVGLSRKFARYLPFWA